MTSPLIPQASIDLLRQLSDASMPYRATIRAPHVSARTGGVRAEAWDNVVTDVPCRVRPDGDARELAEQSKLHDVSRYLVAMPLTATVAHGNQLEITGTNRDGVDWTLTVLVAGVETWRTVRKLRCTYVSGEMR